MKPKDIDQIAEDISETDEPSGFSYDTCPKCGQLSSASGDITMCSNPQCSNYDEEYATTIISMHSMSPMTMPQGTMITKNGKEIEFIGLKDMGHYYVVFIPSVTKVVMKNHKHIRHREFTKIKSVWPMEGLKELKQELMNANVASGYRTDLLRGKIEDLNDHGYYYGAKGGYEITRTAKTITIGRQNVVRLTFKQ